MTLSYHSHENIHIPEAEMAMKQMNGQRHQACDSRQTATRGLGFSPPFTRACNVGHLSTLVYPTDGGEVA